MTAVPRLFREAARQGRFELVAAACEVGIPPLSLMGFASLSGLVVLLAGGALTGNWWPAALLFGVGLLTVCSVGADFALCPPLGAMGPRAQDTALYARQAADLLGLCAEPRTHLAKNGPRNGRCRCPASPLFDYQRTPNFRHAFESSPRRLIFLPSVLRNVIPIRLVVQCAIPGNYLHLFRKSNFLAAAYSPRRSRVASKGRVA